MSIVSTGDTRNPQWANNAGSFGRRMLAKMGWKGDGSGLGRDQQGSSTHLRAVRRAENLGIGAENDAFGEKGWRDTNAGFHGVLANLNREHGGAGESGNSGEEEDRTTKKRRMKEERKRRKREEKRMAKNRGGSAGSTDVRLPQNKVRAGHARKMREAKDIRNKSAEDMAAVFGVKADNYKCFHGWPSTSAVKDASGVGFAHASPDDPEGEKKRRLKKKSKESKEKKCRTVNEKMEKERKKRKQSSEEGGSGSEDRKKRSKKDKSNSKKDKSNK